MKEHFLTIGLYDAKTKKQEISTEDAKKYIEDTLIFKYGVYAFTMIDCAGVYQMQDTGVIVREPSIRLEIANDEMSIETVQQIIADFKQKLNQESILYKTQESYIDFDL